MLQNLGSFGKDFAKMMVFTLHKKYWLVSQLFGLFPYSDVAAGMQPFEIMVFLVKEVNNEFLVVFDWYTFWFQ